MQVNGNAPVNGANGTQRSGGGAQTADYNAFLQLLVAQLKNQDPTEPMKSTEYLAQLASFSQVEQSTRTNAKLDALLTSSALAQVDGLIGRTVTSPDGEVTGKVVSLRLYSDGLLAKLDNGTELPVVPGLTIS